MHRELAVADDAFTPPSDLTLYFLTGLIGILLGIDLGPLLIARLQEFGISLPTWSREVGGFRWALIAAVVGGARILYVSLEALLDGKLGADLALALACIAAILLREWVVAAEVVFIGLVGECLEAFTFARTQAAVRKLQELFPLRCWVLRNGAEVRVFTTELVVGDRVVVKPGGKVPVDGVVLDGRSCVDTSSLTGESIPLDKGPGDEILAGSVNQFGTLTIEARKVAKETVAGQVIDLTAKALKDKAPTERYADLLARWFLPLVLGLAVLTFAANLVYQLGRPRPEGVTMTPRAAIKAAAYPALGVLVVACPCALILATPAAVIAALGRLAGTGVLIKGGSALERLALVRAFAFDKTGTLTEGKLELGDVLPLAAVSIEEILHKAASAEQRSEHPLARVVVEAAQARGLILSPATDFLITPGAGVLATIDGKRILVGNRRLLAEQGIALSASAEAALAQCDAGGQSSLLVVRDGEVIGVIGARDTLRPDAAGALAGLRELGIEPIVLLTGDRLAAAQAVGGPLKIDEIAAELLPAQKVERIARLAERPPSQYRGRFRLPELVPGGAAMVGDGVNDAPALAAATVGIAIGGGPSDIAAEAGDIIILHPRPLAVLPLLVRLSRATTKTIRQNIIIFAFAVNLVGVLLTGWLWPLIATAPDWYESAPLVGVIYHQLGSLAVLLNSMRLLAFERVNESSTLRRLRGTLSAVDDLFGRFRFEDFLHEAIHQWKRIAWVLLVGGGVGYGLSGLTQIAPDEIGLVRTFGKVADADLTPGLHLRWPAPIETVLKVRPNGVRTVEVGFRWTPKTPALEPSRGVVGRPGMPEARRVSGPIGQAWASPHLEGPTRVRDESVMITGDDALVEVLVTVQYRIADPRAFHFGTRDPDSLLRSATEAVLRELVGSRPFGELLTTERTLFQQQALARLTERSTSLVPGGIGVALESLTIHDLHPPEQVVPAYHAVAQAMEEAERAINEAEARKLSRIRAAKARAADLIRKAESSARQTIEQAEATRALYLAWHRNRHCLPDAEEARLWSEFVAGREGFVTRLQRLLRERERLLIMQRALSDLRLYWETVTTVLRRKTLTIVETNGKPARLHLFLMDLEQRLAPVLPPTPNRSRRFEDEGP